MDFSEHGLERGEVVYEDAEGLFKITYDPPRDERDWRHKHHFVLYVLFGGHWSRISRAVTIQSLFDKLSDFKEKIRDTV